MPLPRLHYSLNQSTPLATESPFPRRYPPAIRAFIPHFRHCHSAAVGARDAAGSRPTVVPSIRAYILTACLAPTTLSLQISGIFALRLASTCIKTKAQGTSWFWRFYVPTDRFSRTLTPPGVTIPKTGFDDVVWTNKDVPYLPSQYIRVLQVPILNSYNLPPPPSPPPPPPTPLLRGMKFGEQFDRESVPQWRIRMSFAPSLSAVCW